MGESRRSQKMQNRGNEAKEYLKTKDITLFNAAIFVRFACSLCASDPKLRNEPHISRKRGQDL